MSHDKPWVYAVALTLAAMVCSSCQQALRYQDKPKSYGARPLLDDAAPNQPPPGTLPFEPREPHVETTTDTHAVSYDFAALSRGKEQYHVFCSPCHGLTGEGDGMVVQRGFSKPPKLEEQRLLDASNSHLFAVVTEGAGAMPAYDSQISERDRWCIVGFVRALQLSHSIEGGHP